MGWLKEIAKSLGMWDAPKGGFVDPERKDTHGLRVELEIEKHEKMIRDTVCDCEFVKDTEYLVAESLSVIKAFYEYCCCNDCAILNVLEFSDIYYRAKRFEIIVDGLPMEIDIPTVDVFTKSACLTCGTCLGWRYNRGLNQNARSTSYNCTSDYFKEIIDEMLKIKRKAQDKTNKAKEICNENK